MWLAFISSFTSGLRSLTHVVNVGKIFHFAFQCMIHGLSPLFLLFACRSSRLLQYLYRHELARIHVDGFVYLSKLPRSEHISYCRVSHLRLPGSRCVWSRLSPGGHDGLRLIHNSSSDAGVLFIAAKNVFSVLDLLHRANRILMPYQLELNEVSPFTTHSKYSVELRLYDDLAKAFMLKRHSVFTVDLSCSI